MIHNRKRFCNRRAGCKLCKPWKVNGYRTGRRAFAHIVTCVVCGQNFDMRDERQLEHHEQEMHQSCRAINAR